MHQDVNLCEDCSVLGSTKDAWPVKPGDVIPDYCFKELGAAAKWKHGEDRDVNAPMFNILSWSLGQCGEQAVYPLGVHLSARCSPLIWCDELEKPDVSVSFGPVLSWATIQCTGDGKLDLNADSMNEAVGQCSQRTQRILASNRLRLSATAFFYDNYNIGFLRRVRGVGDTPHNDVVTVSDLRSLISDGRVGIGLCQLLALLISDRAEMVSPPLLSGLTILGAFHVNAVSAVFGATEGPDKPLLVVKLRKDGRHENEMTLLEAAPGVGVTPYRQLSIQWEDAQWKVLFCSF